MNGNDNNNDISCFTFVCDGAFISGVYTYMPIFSISTFTVKLVPSELTSIKLTLKLFSELPLKAL